MMIWHVICWVTCAHLWNYFTGQPVFWKYNLKCFYEVVCTEPFHLLYDQEFDVVIYHIKIILVINGKDVTVYRYLWSVWNFMWHCFIVWSCFLEVKKSKASFFFYNFLYVSVHGNPVYGLAYQQPCPLYSHVVHAEVLQCHIWMTSMAAGLFHLSFFIGKFWSTSLTACLCGHHLALLATPNCSAIMQFVISIRDYCIDGNAYARDFFISVCFMVVSG